MYSPEISRLIPTKSFIITYTQFYESSHYFNFDKYIFKKASFNIRANLIIRKQRLVICEFVYCTLLFSSTTMYTEHINSIYII